MQRYYKQGELAIAGKYTRLNGQIQASELRVIDETGAQLGGNGSKRDALDLTRERELDLVRSIARCQTTRGPHCGLG